jgi:hypothetical protein
MPTRRVTLVLLVASAMLAGQLGCSTVPRVQPQASGGSSGGPSGGTSQPRGAQDYTCRPRPDDLASPPPISPDELAIIDPETGERLVSLAEGPDLPPLCPEGELPVPRGIQAPKADPFPVQSSGLVGPAPRTVASHRHPFGTAGQAPGRLQPALAASVPLMLLPPPWAGELRTAARVLGQPPTIPGLPCDYARAWSGKSGAGRGAGSLARVEAPTVNVGHSLFEVAAHQAGGWENYVEIGWRVAPDQESAPGNPVPVPRLFVFWWNNNVPMCYNGEDADPVCPYWHQYAPNVAPGITVLTPGDTHFFGMYLYNGNWWGRFDNVWVGYYPGSLWEIPPSQSNEVSWFGEVCTGLPLNEMGSGFMPPNPAAATWQWGCRVGLSNYSCQAVMDPQIMPEWPEYEIDLGPVPPSGLRRYGGPNN